MNNSTNNATKDTNDTVMFYLASVPIMCRHAVEDQCQWGQFVDIESNTQFVPMNAGCYTTCSTIKETSEEIPECAELWYKDPANAGCSTDPANAGCSTDPIEMRRSVLPLLFSYDLLFFTHICLRDLFVDGDIKPLHLETLCDAIREYI